MLLKFKHLMNGPGPSEAIVGVNAASGRIEEVVVDTSLLKAGYLDVGPIVTHRDGQVLIELPREAASGRVRIWVSEAEFAKEPQPA